MPMPYDKLPPEIAGKYAKDKGVFLSSEEIKITTIPRWTPECKDPQDLNPMDCGLPAVPIYAGMEGIRTRLRVERDTGTFSHNVVIDVAKRLAGDKRALHMSRIQRGIRQAIALIEEAPTKSLESAIQFVGAKAYADFVRLRTTYSFSETSPISDNEFIEVYDVSMAWDNSDYTCVTVKVIGTTVCPCAGHQQRAEVHCGIIYADKHTDYASFESIINAVNSCFSARTHSIVKKDDEMQMTDMANLNPMFIEDLARKVLNEVEGVVIGEAQSIVIKARAYDSIHRHNVIAWANSGALIAPALSMEVLNW